MESSEGDTTPANLFLSAIPGTPGSDVTILFIAILFLLLISAIVAGAETAYFSLTAKDITFLKTKQRGRAFMASTMLEQPKLLLASLLVANNFINIAIVIATSFLISLILPGLHGYLAFGVNVVCVTFLLVLFGEVLPKVYASQNNLRMAVLSAPFVRLLFTFFLPVSKLLVSSTRFIEVRLNSKSANTLSNEDFEHAIELTVGHSATKEEVNIFKGILKFGAITARQVMKARMDVSSLDYDLTFDEVKKHCIEAGYSRLPVYKDTIDTIAGIIYTKDFLPYDAQSEIDWHTLIRPAYFVHEGKLIDDLLKEFQSKRIHFAVVVDEFGGTSGIVTLEDIIEEIIGDIKDEFDEDDQNYKKIDDQNFIFEGKILINDFCRIINVASDQFEKARGESDSLAGLILEIAGKFPVVNEVVRFEHYEFTILSIEKMRIQRVKFTIRPKMLPESQD